MGFDWIKYLELAQYMAENSKNFPDDEACCRASVSRAYYSAFCTARCFIRDTDGDFYNGGDAHHKVREHFINTNSKLKQKIANQLKDIHMARRKADYEDVLREKPSNMAFKTITWAKKIIREIEELRTIKESN